MSAVRESADIDGGVVIGYDGSESSEKALLWAADDCDRRGCKLTIVRAWTVATATRPDSWSPSYVPGLPEFEEAVRDQTERCVEELLGDYPDVRWDVQPVYGQPAKVLIAASEHAELLVVGHGGGGGLAALLMGSVSDQCVKNGSCPVVVVQTDADAEHSEGRSAEQPATEQPATGQPVT